MIQDKKVIRVKVKFFASYREIIGLEEEVVELKSGESFKSLRELIISAHPTLKDFEESMLYSLNETYVEDEDVELSDGDIVAFFPPLSGG